MHLGVDFGTTRTIAASVDRGNYPVVSFLDSFGDAHEFFPSVVARNQGRLVYGFEALAAADDGAPLVRSFKRALAAPDVNTDTTIMVGDEAVPLLDVLTGFLSALRTALTASSSLRTQGAKKTTLEHTVIAVPAHAHGAQRFLTLEAFRRAGFEVTAMVNEPSAAGFEYTHRQGRTLSSRRTRVIVYDLGGGTFDASLVRVDGTSHDVLASLGLNHLGGDDFDAVLARCALERAGVAMEELAPRAVSTLLQECREAKESLSPQTRRLVLDVAGTPVILSVDDFYSAASGLVEDTIEAMRPIVGGLDDDAPELTDVAGIYLVGGASGLPLVPRQLRARFGRRVHRSPYPAASTAIGLAIAADDAAGYSLTDRLSRGFGVFREGDAGQSLKFDPILARDATVPKSEKVVVTRRYAAAHNVGWFRFVEYSSVDDNGEPRGDIVPFADVLFPFDANLQRNGNLTSVTVERREHGPLVEEQYVIDPHGMVEVRITDLDTGYSTTQAIKAAAKSPARSSR